MAMARGAAYTPPPPALTAQLRHRRAAAAAHLTCGVALVLFRTGIHRDLAGGLDLLKAGHIVRTTAVG